MPAAPSIPWDEKTERDVFSLLKLMETRHVPLKNFSFCDEIMRKLLFVYKQQIFKDGVRSRQGNKPGPGHRVSLQNAQNPKYHNKENVNRNTKIVQKPSNIVKKMYKPIRRLFRYVHIKV